MASQSSSSSLVSGLTDKLSPRAMSIESQEVIHAELKVLCSKDKKAMVSFYFVDPETPGSSARRCRECLKCLLAQVDDKGEPSAEALAKCLIKNSKNGGLTNLISHLRNNHDGFVANWKQAVRSGMEATADLVRVKISKELKAVPGGIFGLSTDGWESPNGEHFAAVYAVYDSGKSDTDGVAIPSTPLLKLTTYVDKTNFTGMYHFSMSHV